MRYDNTPIYFQKLTPGEYDPATGNYGEDMISEDMKYASSHGYRYEYDDVLSIPELRKAAYHSPAESYGPAILTGFE